MIQALSLPERHTQLPSLILNMRIPFHLFILIFHFLLCHTQVFSVLKSLVDRIGNGKNKKRRKYPVYKHQNIHPRLTEIMPKWHNNKRNKVIYVIPNGKVNHDSYNNQLQETFCQFNKTLHRKDFLNSINRIQLTRFWLDGFYGKSSP